MWFLNLLAATLCILAHRTQGNRTTDSFSDSISLIKCCPTDQLYKVGFDVCLPWPNDVIPNTTYPPIYSSISGDTLALNRSHFSSNYLAVCPPEYVGQSTNKFKIFDDGSFLETDGVRRNAGEFCLDQETASSKDPTIVARFCIPDPCVGDTTSQCIRKCCPNGMMINEKDRICQTSSLPLTVPFLNESVTLNSENLSPGLVVRDGVFVDCDQRGINVLRPSEDSSDEFHLLPDGKIRVPSYLKTGLYDADTHEYCLDHFLTENNTVHLQALTCFVSWEEDNEDQSLARTIYPIFLVLSAVFLVITFVIYAIISELHNTHGVTIICQTASMAVMYISLAAIQLNPDFSDHWCIGTAIITHFTFLSTFTWLNVLSFDIWWTFKHLFVSTSNVRTNRPTIEKRFIYYSAFAWLVPTLIVLVGQSIDNIEDLWPSIIRPGFGVKSCWFYTRSSYITYLYGPLIVLILSNLFFMTWTTIILCQTSIDTVQQFQSKQKFKTVLILFLLMGVSWMTEIISFLVGGSAYIWIPTDILNILTGIVVFFIFVCRPNVWSLLKRKFSILKNIDFLCPACMKNEQKEDDDSPYDFQETNI